MPPRPRNITIPLPYRIFFLYIDPLICFSGAYLAIFSPSTFLASGVPSSLRPSASLIKLPGTPSIDPLVSHLLNSIGSYSVGILVLQVLLLHGFKNAPSGLNVRLWRILQFSILTVDLGLLYGGYAANPAAFRDLKSWDSGDWTNNGILGGVALIRSAFLLGVGF